MIPGKYWSYLTVCTPAALLACTIAALAQAPAEPPRREPTPNDSLKSPEVLDDNRVTFRLYAPKATEVSITGDWVTQDLGKGGLLEKDSQGIWSITVAPLPPDFYSYAFTMDGVRIVDPKNPLIKQGVSSLDSMFLLPGKEAEFEKTQAVPHGVIRMNWYESSTLGTQRRLHVYTPPGYDHSLEQLPVLYLLHGGGDEDSGWSTIGRAGFIVDNLLSAKRGKPMIIVMPNGSLPRPTNLPTFTPGTTPSPEFTAAMAASQERFTKELMNDIVPFIEANYRVMPDPDHRAIAGLSMGGGQTLRVFTSHPDKFAYVAIWSAGIAGRNASEFEERNAGFLAKSDKLNQQVKLLSICAGEKDFALAGSKSLVEMLNKHGIHNEFHTSPGGHTWINWRHYLADLAPQLFQQ
jgi:enterochelin esterase family protein